MSYTKSKVDAIVIGAGISGIVTAKCLQEAGFKVLVIERTGEVGGLWAFKEHGYGVMRFTHINVSKHNYCFSDYPFPDDVPDFPHNKDMAKYVISYTKHFGVDKLIRFQTQVNKIERSGDNWLVELVRVEDDGKGGLIESEKETFITKYIAVASGHHAKPNKPSFPGQDTFTGEILHSVDYKDAITNRMVGKKVLVVGIGNSAVDVAVNCASMGRSKKVYLSTRSGAWVLPNYIFGRPTDHYACRLFLSLPWKLSTYILETVVTLISGSPWSWGLNPKMHALQTQPTVSPTLIHHIQRGQVKIVPNIKEMSGQTVQFMNGDSAEVDQVVLATGYSIDLPFLSKELRDDVFVENSNSIKLFKNVFSPNVGSSLAFIGFVQPASGGILSMSETQARWFAELCKGKIQLPSKKKMTDVITKEEKACNSRYHSSARHTIQRDPIVYNDEISSYYGAKPVIWKHPSLAWRLLLGSCGAAQWRLQGPHSWSKAAAEVRKVPVTDLLHYSAILVLALIVCLLSVLTCTISGMF